MLTRRCASAALKRGGPLAARLRPVLRSTVAVRAQTFRFTSTASAPPSHAVEHEFKAETQKLLSIVANSLYTEKEIFCRELISNASDALEKLRYAQATNATGLPEGDIELGIKITVDGKENTFTIADSGIGMTEAELHENLGTIAHSGSKKFLESATTAGSADGKPNVIGAFGVGFYSAFMVGDEITVYTRKAENDSKGYVWRSSGLGRYTIEEAPEAEIGTKIVVKLKSDAKTFANKKKVEDIVKKYSNFIMFPITVNNDRVNKVMPIWTRSPDQTTPAEHDEFYKMISDDYSSPTYTLQYRADVPLMIQSVFYVPSSHSEAFRMERMTSGVALYSRRVLIQQHAKLLPDYLRFMKGVVDSEDIPLNLSRELLQGSALMRKLSNSIVTRILKFLNQEAAKDETKYLDWYRQFAPFIREGVVTEPQSNLTKELVNLLRYETSFVPEEGNSADKEIPISLSKYVDRMPSDQPSIYYHFSSSRNLALESPYYEPFKSKGVEVVLCYDVTDSFVMSKVGEALGKPVKTLEEGRAELDSFGEKTAANTADASSIESFPEDDFAPLQIFVTETLGSQKVERVTVKASTSTSSTPALLVDHDSPSMRNMMRMMARNSKGSKPMPDPPAKLELNAAHPVVVGINRLRKEGGHEQVLKLVLEQLLDNATISAGLYDDPAQMLQRLNKLLQRIVQP